MLAYQNGATNYIKYKHNILDVKGKALDFETLSILYHYGVIAPIVCTVAVHDWFFCTRTKDRAEG